MGKPKKKAVLAIVRYLLLIILFIIAFFLIRWFYDSLSGDSYIPPLTPVETTNPEFRSIDKTMVLSSTVEARNIVPVTPYLDGTIVEYYVKEGDIVKDGDVIAKIDPEPYRLQYEQANAAYLGYASSFERVEALYDENIATKQDYDTLKAQLDAIAAQLELAKLQLSYTDVVSHSAGTVQKTLSSKGSTAVKGAPIALVSDMDDLIIDVRISEKYFDIFNGDNSNIEIAVVRPGSDYSKEVVATATIENVSQYIDPSSKYFSVKLTLDENKEAFRPGMYVKVYITYDTKEGYSLDRDSVKLDGSAYYVEDGKAVYVDLSNSFSNDEYIIVPDELKDKAFISKGKDSVFSGEEVNVLKGVER